MQGFADWNPDKNAVAATEPAEDMNEGYDPEFGPYDDPGADQPVAEAADPTRLTLSVYSNIDRVELFLNGKSLGSKPRDRMDKPRQWQVQYVPGVVKAVGRDKTGKQIAVDEIRTAGSPVRVVLTAEHASLPNDWDDVCYVRAALVDDYGVINPNASDLVSFKVSGPGVVAAVDNGSLSDHDPFQATQRHAYRGTCVAIIRSTAASGAITVTASAPKMADGSVTLTAAPTKVR
jgi:beta-galactosidase